MLWILLHVTPLPPCFLLSVFLSFPHGSRQVRWCEQATRGRQGCPVTGKPGCSTGPLTDCCSSPESWTENNCFLLRQREGAPFYLFVFFPPVDVNVVAVGGVKFSQLTLPIGAPDSDQAAYLSFISSPSSIPSFLAVPVCLCVSVST